MQKKCTKGLRNAERARKFYSKHTRERYYLQLRLERLSLTLRGLTSNSKRQR